MPRFVSGCARELPRTVAGCCPSRGRRLQPIVAADVRAFEDCSAIADIITTQSSPTRYVERFSFARSEGRFGVMMCPAPVRGPRTADRGPRDAADHHYDDFVAVWTFAQRRPRQRLE